MQAQKLVQPYRIAISWKLETNRHHFELTTYFLAEPSLLGIADSRGIELIHPRRESCSSRLWSDKDNSNWITRMAQVDCYFLRAVVCWKNDQEQLSRSRLHATGRRRHSCPLA